MKEIPIEEVIGLHDGERLLRALAWAPDTTEIVVPDRVWNHLVLLSSCYPAIRWDRIHTRLEICHAMKWYPIVAPNDGRNLAGLYVRGDCVVTLPFHGQG